MTTKTHSRTCLCPPPGSATWHCAHFVLKIFAPMSTKVKEKERDNASVKRVARKNTKEGKGMLKEILYLSRTLGDVSCGSFCKRSHRMMILFFCGFCPFLSVKSGRCCRCVLLLLLLLFDEKNF